MEGKKINWVKEIKGYIKENKIGYVIERGYLEQGLDLTKKNVNKVKEHTKETREIYNEVFIETMREVSDEYDYIGVEISEELKVSGLWLEEKERIKQYRKEVWKGI